MTAGALLSILEHNNRRVDTVCAEISKTDEYMDLIHACNAYFEQLKCGLAPEQLDAIAEMDVLQEQCAELCYHACYLAGLADGFAMRQAVAL